MSLSRPLDPAAVQAANQRLWADNPELNGRQLTLAAGEPETTYRKEWVAAYQEALANQNPAPPTTGDGAVGNPSNPCPGPLPKEQEKAPLSGSKTKDNEITIEFDPTQSEKVGKCKRIVFIQTVQKIVDGTPIMPGDFNIDWKYKDEDALTEGHNKGLRVDYIKGEKTPYYNDPNNTGKSGYGDVGKKNGGTTKATMGDAPTTGGGDKGMYHKDTNASGYKTVKTVFETFALCAEGNDCGKYYEGITWTHTRRHDEAGTGKSKITGYPTEPSDAFKKAIALWNKRYKFTPCK